jgi:anthranilate synthase component 2
MKLSFVFLNKNRINLGLERILILDNYDSFTYNLVHYAEAIPNFEVDVFRNDEISIEDIDRYDTIILSPGPGLPKNAGILNEVIKTYAATKKILGVCLGMQAIGEVFGGTLINLSTVFHGVPTPIVVLDKDDLLFKNLPQQFNVGRYHSWIISNKNFPKELNITSIEKNNQIMSFTHKTHKVYGVQFHPESILTEYGKEMVANFLAI